jgi:hypothetical protein
MYGRAADARVPVMAEFLLEHRHDPSQCAASFAAWQGFASPLRRRGALCSCLTGDHALWWRVTAAGPSAALALLPPFVAARTRAVTVRDVEIP